ncbi:MAG: hypothetical protein QGG73_07770 [Candidatus Hydrogenedentes bacterium]|jgi:hypothetical protein|nr:hypothetical protein [Candidatus Hydrogenedentota bacterium]
MGVSKRELWLGMSPSCAECGKPYKSDITEAGAIKALEDFMSMRPCMQEFTRSQDYACDECLEKETAYTSGWKDS